MSLYCLAKIRKIYRVFYW